MIYKQTFKMVLCNEVFNFHIYILWTELKSLTSTPSAWLAQHQKLISDVKLVLNVKNCVQFKQ